MEYQKPIKITRKGKVNGSQHGQSGKAKPDGDDKAKSGDVIDIVDGSQNL